MARSRSKKSRIKKKMRGDWVYRGLEFDADTGAPLATQVASYTDLDRNGGAYTLAVGTPAGIVLYDSYDYLTQGTRLIAGGIATMMGRESRPEGRRPTIHAVEVDTFWIPTTWTAGTDFSIIARLVICDQNMSTGGLDLPLLYTLHGGGSLPASASMFADGWGNLHTAYLRQAFATENDMSRFRLKFRWKGRRTLAPNLCLGLYIESGGPATGSTSLRFSPRCRTLVSDANA